MSPITTSLVAACAARTFAMSASAIVVAIANVFRFIASPPRAVIRSSDSEVFVHHCHFLRQLGGTEGLCHSAALHEVETIRERGREPEILLHHEQGVATSAQLENGRGQPFHDNRRESFRDLIQQQEPGAGTK